MDGTKKKWQSKTIWAGVYVILRGVYEGLSMYLAPELGWNLPPIPVWVDTIVTTVVGGVVVKGRMDATKTIE